MATKNEIANMVKKAQDVVEKETRPTAAEESKTFFAGMGK